MQVSMTKVEIIGPKGLLFDTLALLHRLGILHVESLSKELLKSEFIHRMKLEPAQEEEKQRLEILRTRVNGILSELGPSLQKTSSEKGRSAPIWAGSEEELTQKLSSAIDKLEARTAKLAQQKSSLEVELILLEQYKPILEKIQPLAKEIEASDGFESVALLLERDYKEGLELLEKDLAETTKDQLRLVSSDVDEDTTAAIIIFNRTFSRSVRSFLASAHVNELKLPPYLAGKPFGEAFGFLKERMKILPQKIKDIKEELSEISAKWSARLLDLRQILLDRLAEFEELPKLGCTAYAFFVRGWLPQNEVGKTRELLKKEVGEGVSLTKLKLTSKEWEEAPVVLKNPLWARPFQLFFKLVQPPKYGTIDPTSFVAIFFPFLFGLIVGDLGYGLVILILALLIKRKLREMVIAQVFTSIALISSISAMFFGTFLFFEIFGDLGEKVIHVLWRLEPPYFQIGGFNWPILRGDPEESFYFLLIMALAIGVIHLSIGFVFGIINNIRLHHYRHALEKGGFLLLIISIIFLVLAGWAQLLPPVFTYLAFTLLVLSVGGIGYGGGIKGVIEIFGTFANIVSYSRLMALSLAGAIMANAINVLASDMGSLGPVAIVGGTLLAIFLHAINIIISVLSPSVHSLRLHLVECFSKFYEPATVSYQPFKKIGGEGR